MKKILCVFLAAFLLPCLFASCGNQNATLENPRAEYTRDLEGTTLNVFNWGVNISDGSEGSFNINKAFENLTGIKVNYMTYESNEALYAKLKSGAVSYDVIIPSDYMIERMIDEDMIQKLDYSKITNFDLIDAKYKNLFYDPANEYSVPYTVGLVGLIYNSTMVEEAPDSWAAMWDERYADNILTFNNPRDAFAIAQFLLGYDVNSTDKTTWEAAADKLKEQNKILQQRVMDEIFNKMEAGNAILAPYYAGDFLTMQENNPDLEMVFPKEGTNIFVDAICVPKNAQNYEAAMMYINFLLEPDVSLANAEYICYASPNTAVVSNPEYCFYQNEYLYPDEGTLPPTEYFHDIDPEIRSYYEKLWEEILIAD